MSSCLRHPVFNRSGRTGSAAYEGGGRRRYLVKKLDWLGRDTADMIQLIRNLTPKVLLSDSLMTGSAPMRNGKNGGHYSVGCGAGRTTEILERTNEGRQEAKLRGIKFDAGVLSTAPK